MSTLLEEFKEYLKEMNQYDHVTGLLQWDMQTTVPKLGQAAHVDALTYFSTKSFEMGRNWENFWRNWRGLRNMMR